MAVLYIIYLTFVGVGLQSGVMGSVWPIMRLELGLPIGIAGVLKSLTSGATVIAALTTHRIVRRSTPGKVALVSVTMMALGFLGYAWSSSLAFLLLFSIPLGLGVGYIDTSMNNYTALHYEAKHMNWLHSFWGVGASLGPALIALALSAGFSYRVGWSLIGTLELSLAVALVFLHKKFIPQTVNTTAEEDETQSKQGGVSHKSVLVYLLASCFFYSIIEVSMSLWGVSFLVEAKHIDPAKAAFIGSLFFIGITAGRMVGGFVSLRLSNEKLIGLGAALCGVSLLLLAVGPSQIAPVVFFAIGLGCGPIFPSLLFEIPRRCVTSESQKIIGLAMASMYTASIISPIGLGFLGQLLGMQSMAIVQISSLILLSFFLWRFLRTKMDTDTSK